MKVGFLVNQIDNRGTGNAVYDYAHFNEVLLGNDSAIFTFADGDHDKDALSRYLARFGRVLFTEKIKDSGLDALYHIKSGEDDGFGNTLDIPYLVHAVFNIHVHGTRYAGISQWLGVQHNVPWVPHIVVLPDLEENLRKDLGIPEDAIVFGRHGGFDTFDVPFVWSAINRVLEERDDIWFLFMNTYIPDMEFNRSNHIVDIQATTDPTRKRIFINTCDAMLHARVRGETFGIAVGEFDICGKPVLTYGASEERAHMKQLGNYYIYFTEDDLVQGLTVVDYPNWESWRHYSDFNPSDVMTRFKMVFLDGL